MLALFILSLSLTLVACGRRLVDTREFSLPGGTCSIERWDDPVDNLKSYRLLWRPDGAEEGELVHEIWGRLDPQLEPKLVDRDVLTLVLGERCFERSSPGQWQPCGDEYNPGTPTP